MTESNPEAPDPGTSSPRTTARRIDVAAMKAFAHPLRMQIYRHLQEQGSATSAQLARALDESSGQTSYHLRQLERHGFVEEDSTRGTARERWWRPLGFSYSDRDWAGDSAEVDVSRPEATASLLLQRTQTEQYATSAHAWLDRAPHEGPAWRWAGMRSQTIADLTPDELVALNDALTEVLDAHVERAKAAHNQAGQDVRRVQILIHSFPLAPGSEG